jgi:hypothetical protein
MFNVEIVTGRLPRGRSFPLQYYEAQVAFYF